MWNRRGIKTLRVLLKGEDGRCEGLKEAPVEEAMMASERWEGRIGVISSRYRSIGEGAAGSTVVELFGRAASGESVCVLVHGLRPHRGRADRAVVERARRSRGAG